MVDREIEIQVKVENSENLLKFLAENAEFRGEKRQLDEYFSPEYRNFLAERPIKEWLRLRDANGRYSLNYKNWQYGPDGKSHHCDEYESHIESLDQVRKILDVLGMKSIVTVDKVRKIWMYQDYEIAMDSVKSLGDFVEIEYKGQDDSLQPAQITEDMVDFLKDLNVGKIEKNNGGYPFMLLFANEIKLEAQ